MPSPAAAALVPPRPIHLSAKGLHTFTPEGLKDRDPEVVFHIWIPTFAQRDSLSQLLFSFNVMPVTIDHGRSVMLSELYEVYDPNPATAEKRIIEQEDPDDADKTIEIEVEKLRGDPDEMAAFLEGYWQRADIYEQIIGQWAIQEKERLIDQFHGADKTDANAMPDPPYTPRETARAKRIAMEMLELSPAYCRLQSRYADYDAREDRMLFRLFVAGWTGFEARPVRLKAGPLTEQCVEQLREEMSTLHDDDNQFYLEVVSEIRALMKIDQETEKNSASPRGQSSSLSGSDARSGESDGGDGSWTASNTEPVPSLESAPTSDTSLTSASGKEGRKRRRGQTAAPSSTSPRGS